MIASDVFRDQPTLTGDTEITRLVVDYALDTVGLHRLSLGLYDFNPRAQRIYEKCRFRPEAGDATHCAGMASGMTSCSCPSWPPTPVLPVE